jgi:hypothetical protein
MAKHVFDGWARESGLLQKHERAGIDGGGWSARLGCARGSFSRLKCG